MRKTNNLYFFRLGQGDVVSIFKERGNSRRKIAYTCDVDSYFEIRI